MSKQRFVNLDVTSAYSFLYGTFSPRALVKRARALGQEAVALTDIWNTWGVARFYRCCLKEGMQPIVGARIEIEGAGWVVLLAKDLSGYSNICRIISAGLAGQKNTQRPPSPLLLKKVEGLGKGIVCICGCHGSLLRKQASKGRLDACKRRVLLLERIFGERNLCLCLQQNVPSDRDANRLFMEISRKLGLGAVALNHTAYLERGDFQVHKILVEVQRRHHHRDIRPLPNDSFFLLSKEQMSRKMEVQGAIPASGEIASMCSGFSFPKGRLHPPRFRKKEEAERILARRALKCLARKGTLTPFSYIAALDRELETVRKKGLCDFFLLVNEVCLFAREKGIRHSIRGSAAGSLLVHLLHGGPDPIKHGLLFERFINDGRNDLPDIDIDFDSERRDEVTSWLIKRFSPAVATSGTGYSGERMQAALVSTVHTMRVRGAVRLAARAMGYPLKEIDRLSRCLPWSLRGIPLLEAIERLPELKDSPLRHEEALLCVAASMEGLPFQASVHLGGVILVPDHINNWSPVFPSRKGFPVAQLDKDDVDILGLLKLDLLGLRMHTAIKKAMEVLSQEGASIDMDHLPLDDKRTFDLLCSGNTLGVFQIESSGQRNLVGRLQPRCFDDIVIEISLFRPGPVKSDMVNRFIKRRDGAEETDILHECLSDILSPTCGVIVFQEQVLRIVHRFAGFSYSDADAFRRAMTKDRSKGEMGRLKAAFMEGAKRMGRDRALSELVFERIAAFAAYGFCKAHAVSFSHITWQSAWLKAHHPLAFYIGLLNAGHVGSYPPFVILNEARRAGIKTLPPHVNVSGWEYRREGHGIRVPLHVIRGIGIEGAKKIVSERQKGGRFRSWEDFFSRIRLSRAARYGIIFSGALSGLPVDTSQGLRFHERDAA